jgi:RNA recognition motif-containing protein
MTTIYVGNLNFRTTEEEIQSLFGRFGEVHSVKIITDKMTGRSRGFGFVEMDPEIANTAIEELNGADFNGRNLKVNEAKERQERPAGAPRQFDGDRGGRPQQRRRWDSGF